MSSAIDPPVASGKESRIIPDAATQPNDHAAPAEAPAIATQPVPTKPASPPPTSSAPLDVVSAIDSVATAVSGATSAVTSVLPSTLTGVPSTESTVPPPPTTQSGRPSRDAPSTPALPTTQSGRPLHGAPTLPPRPEEDPKIIALKSMFPDFDTIVLQSVLEGVRGSQDRAIEVLLGMSDPSYVSQEQPNHHDTHLDEELARRLTLEDQDEEHAHALAAQIEREQAQGPFRPRTAPAGAQAQPPFADQWGYGASAAEHQLASAPAVAGQPREKDAVTEIQEQFTKIAETGRKTFSSIFSKVKSKIQEFEEQQVRGYAQSQNYAPHPAAGGSAASPPGRAQAAGGAPVHPPNGPSSYFDPRFDAGGAGPSGTIHQGDTPSLVDGVPSPAVLPPTTNQPAPIKPLGGAETPRPAVASPGPTSGTAMPMPAPVRAETKPPNQKADDDDLGYLG